MELKDIRVFVCVPGVGKTHLARVDKRFVDLDDMKARYKYAYEDKTEREMEWTKGNRRKAVREDTDQHMEHVTLDLLQNTDKILLFAPNPNMIAMLVRNGIPYCLIYHSKDCVEEIKARMVARGNQEIYIHSMLDPIDSFHKDSVQDPRPAFKIELQRGEFLSDKLLQILDFIE